MKTDLFTFDVLNPDTGLMEPSGMLFIDRDDAEKFRKKKYGQRAGEIRLNIDPPRKEEREEVYHNNMNILYWGLRGRG